MGVNCLFKTSRGKIVASFALFCALLISSSQFSFAAGKGDPAKGKDLFQANCASCHNPLRDMTGPALQNVDQVAPGGTAWIYKWVHNSSAVLASGDPYANGLFNKFGKVQMPAFPQLSTSDIDNILAYVDSYKAPAGEAQGGAAGGSSGGGGGNNNLLFGILSLVLAILALILMQVNSNLHRLANEKEGVPNKKHIPFYRNKTNIFIGVIVLFMLSGYFLVNAATSIGYEQNYQPRQPIFYSHRVHAGINQISCLYCHAGAEKSRQAMIPSPNICMNCHKAINSYNGPQLYTAEGKAIDGSAEIQKLYDYVGWDPKLRQYTRPGRPIRWIKIHNLPAHVYFNHSQHVVAGKIQCQTCHGPIQNMDEVYQYATLGMGWCINCHRTTAVQFTENKYYTMFTKYQQELKDHQIDSVTVEMVGGTQCQKCHY